MKTMVTNTAQRRLSIASFAGLFLLAVAVPCFSFMQSNHLNNDLPANQLKAYMEKESLLQSFAELGDKLRQCENSQRLNSSDFFNRSADCERLLTTLHGELLNNRDTFTLYKDVNQLLHMADQYYTFIKQSSRDMDAKTKALDQGVAQLNQEKAALQNENQNLKTLLAVAQAKGGGGGGGAAAAPITYIPMPTPSNPNPTPVKIAAGGGGVDCDAKINGIANKNRASCMMINSDVNSIRTEMARISCLIGKTNQIKQSIENNLKDLEKNLITIQN